MWRRRCAERAAGWIDSAITPWRGEIRLHRGGAAERPRLEAIVAPLLRSRGPVLFDQPLASRFDENDCVVYFDEVKVLWERVFVHTDVKMSADQWYATPTHVYRTISARFA